MRQIRVENRFFIDSNILLYTVGADAAKAERANQLMDERPIISVQVLNEFVNVGRKKLKLEWAGIEAGVAHALEYCEVVPVILAGHIRAMQLAKKDKIGIYDANIVAAAELAKCDILYTEDLSHGQKIGRVLIQNPFRAA
jgi:predicted nucleic acid-binding protein